MKFKDWEKSLREHEFAIPDVYDRIKPFAYRKMVKSEPVTMKPLMKKRVALIPLYLCLLLFSFLLFNPNNNHPEHYLAGGDRIAHFADFQEMGEYIKANRQESALYLMDFRESEGLLASLDQKIIVPEYPLSELNEYLEGPVTAAAEDDRLYLTTAAAFKVLHIGNGDLEQIFSLPLEKDAYFSEIHLRDEYIILVYGVSEGNADRDKTTHVLVFNKSFQKLYEYSVTGLYLESQLIGNRLFLVNRIVLDYPLDETPVPEIHENSVKKEIDAGDVAYIPGFGSDAFTIISCLDLTDFFSVDRILLSYGEWEEIYFSADNLYLLNSHQNTDSKLDYGTYTAVIRYDIRKEISYGGSCKIKGALLNKSARSEHEGYFLIAVSSVDYKIFKTLINNRVTPQSFTNKIIVLNVRGGRDVMQVVNSIDISVREHLEGVKFEKGWAYALATSGKLYKINLKNPRNPRFEITNPEKAEIFFYGIKEDLAASIKSDPVIGGFRFTVFGIEDMNASLWSESFEIRYGDLGYFPVLEACNNANAIFCHEIEGKHYLGFAVTNPNRTRGTYFMFEIDYETRTLKQVDFHFTEESYPIRMVASDEDRLIFALSDDAVAVYNYDFEKVGILMLK